MISLASPASLASLVSNASIAYASLGQGRAEGANVVVLFLF